MSKRIGARDLHLDIASNKESELFKWFLACYFFGHRISQDIAVKTWQVFVAHGLTSGRKISAQSWQTLVDRLGEGHYKRYDESTARNLLEMAQWLQDQYHGRISSLIEAAADRADLERRLQEIKGVGPKVTEIFLREIHV